MPRDIRKFGIKRVNHVIIRGVNKQDIFLDKQDKSKFVKEMLNTKERKKIFNGYRKDIFKIEFKGL